MKNNLSILAILLISVSIFAQKTIQRSIYFESANAQLSTASQSYLMALADTLKKYPTYSILLKGHTDATGTAAENQSLSEKRALIVRTELAKNGVPESFMALKAMGTSEPLSNNTTLEGKKRNRRVEIAITFSPPNTSNTTAVAPPKKYQNMMQLYRDLSLNFQDFKINTAKDTIIRGEKGTVLFISKASFEGAPANAIIDFRLKEAYSFSDIISENLSTQSGNKLLQTGGMIYVDAKYKGVDLTLKKEMNVSFSSKESREEGMQLFRGERDSKNNGNIDWLPLNKEGFEEEVILYKTPGQSEPLMISDKEGYIQFKDIIDTVGSTKVFQDKKLKNNIQTVNMDKMNKMQMAMIFAARANPAILESSVENMHHSTFRETYDYYRVKTFAELKQQNSEKWDSLMKVRMTFMEQVGISEENFKKREIRRVQVEDSLKKEYAIWYAANKDSIEKQRKEYAIQYENQRKQAEQFNKIFPFNYLYWLNCDSYNQGQLTTMKVDIPQGDMYNIVFILKQEKMGVRSNTNGKFVNLLTPKNRQGTMVGMKILDGQPYLALLDVNSSATDIKLDYRRVTLEEIKQQLKALDKYW